jgi:hypothetical protein
METIVGHYCLYNVNKLHESEAGQDELSRMSWRDPFSPASS